jgi:hypothetical protein
VLSGAVVLAVAVFRARIERFLHPSVRYKAMHVSTCDRPSHDAWTRPRACGVGEDCDMRASTCNGGRRLAGCEAFKECQGTHIYLTGCGRPPAPWAAMCNETFSEECMPGTSGTSGSDVCSVGVGTTGGGGEGGEGAMSARTSER